MRGRVGGPLAAAVIAAGAAGILTGAASAQTAVCAQCHGAIAASFQKTGMGRSFSRLDTHPTAYLTGQPFHHAASDNFFAMLERGGRIWQRRWQTGFDGKESNVDERQVDFVLGSGNHSRTFLHLTARGTLQELPLAWYAEKGGYWGMNPGYDRLDYPGVTRLIEYQCMFCHNAYPRIPAGHAEMGAEAQYLVPIPEGIDCQRCHGPGERHVAAVRAGAKPEAIRAAIVNPARLSAERELEVCLQCHLETTSRPLPHSVERQNRGPFSYVPGEALGAFRISFDRARGQEDGVEVAHAGYRFLESRCFRESAGKLRCTTCHNPHDIPRGESAEAGYNRVCLTCHGPAIERASASGAHPAGAGCIACHMPKRRTQDAVHMAMTDHAIRRRPPPGDPVAARDVASETPPPYRGPVEVFYPSPLAPGIENQLDVAVAQVRDRSNLDEGLPRLAGQVEKARPREAGYWADLAEAYLAAGNDARTVQSFEEALRRAPGSAVLLLRYGNALVQSRQWAQAETILKAAAARAASDPVAWGLLGQVLWEEGKPAEARVALERALSLNPDLPEPHNYMGALLVSGGDWTGAEQQFREALRIEPGVVEWQTNLANLLAARGRLDEARFDFQRAVRLQPSYPGAHVGYAHLLANAGHLDEAVRELQAAVQLDGQLWRAHLELGELLAERGDAAAAAEQFRLAAQAPDPQVQAAAREALTRMHP